MSSIIYGFHSVTSYLNAHPKQIEIIYLDNKRQDKRQQELLALVKLHDIITRFVTTKELDTLGNTDTHQGVVAIAKPKLQISIKEALASLEEKKNASILVLDGITDPQNLGAIIRTADCFGVNLIILPKNNSANTENPIVAKVSSGAINNLDIVTVNNISQTLELLKQHEFWIAGTALSKDSISLYDFKFKGRIAWVMGSEGTGMRRLVTEHCDYLITIPMKGQTQSLNVSVATGVVLAYTSFMQDL